MIPLLLAAITATILVCAPTEKVFVVTIPRPGKDALEFKVCGKDRLHALVNLGATVWTEDEWNAAMNDCLCLVDGKYKGCKCK